MSWGRRSQLWGTNPLESSRLQGQLSSSCCCQYPLLPKCRPKDLQLNYLRRRRKNRQRTPSGKKLIWPFRNLQYNRLGPRPKIPPMKSYYLWYALHRLSPNSRLGSQLLSQRSLPSSQNIQLPDPCPNSHSDQQQVPQPHCWWRMNYSSSPIQCHY